MKNYSLFLIVLLFSCQSPESDSKWLGRKVDLNSLQPVVNTYHMMDTSGTKVGAMIFGSYFENGKFVSRDTSSFDDGSVYEEAEFILNKTNFELEDVSVAMRINTTKLDVDLACNGTQVNGLYRVTRDTTVTDYPIDSLYNYDIVRSELYMLMHTIDYKAGDTIKFKSLVPTSMTVSDASLYYVSDERVTTEAGTFDCSVIHLMTDGKMPQNRIWITKEKPSKIVKFYVPGSELSIELVKSE